MATKRRQKSSKKSPSRPPRSRGKNTRSAKPPYRKRKKPLPVKISINGKERALLLKSEVVELLGKWPKGVDRMLYASRNGVPWLEIVSNQSGASGAEVRVTAESVCEALERLRRGEQPPLMPSEKKGLEGWTPKKTLGEIPDKAMAALLRAGELLPAGVTSATFNQESKVITLWWSSGDYQHITKRAKPGRNTRVISISFDLQPGKPSPIRPCGEGEED